METLAAPLQIRGDWEPGEQKRRLHAVLPPACPRIADTGPNWLPSHCPHLNQQGVDMTLGVHGLFG